jgi:hypothetical protein
MNSIKRALDNVRCQSTDEYRPIDREPRAKRIARRQTPPFPRIDKFTGFRNVCSTRLALML